MNKIFYNVDTQKDFMNSDGALYVPDAESIKSNLALLTKFAGLLKSIPIIGSVDRHFGTEEYKEREGELSRWQGQFPDHCMYGTEGELIIDEVRNVDYFCSPKETILERFYNWTHEPTSVYVENPLVSVAFENIFNRRVGSLLNFAKNLKDRTMFQVFFEKQSYDVFTNPAFEKFLEIAKVGEAVVYGVATDFCVKAAVLGMQKRGVQCYVVEDAIKGVFPETTQKALEEMILAGAKFVTTKDILEEKNGI